MNIPSIVRGTVTKALPKHLKRLEAESIEIMREVVAEFKKPVMLYSIGKDSSVMLHLAVKAFYPAPLAVSGAARRHDLEVPRDDRVPRRDGAAAQSRSARSHQSGRRRPRHQSVCLGLVRAHACDEDRSAEAGARQIRLRCRLRRRAPRRGKEPRQGAHLLVPLARIMSGIRATSARNCGICSTRGCGRANRSASFRCRIGPSSTSGPTSCCRTFRSCRSISPRSARS